MSSEDVPSFQATLGIDLDSPEPFQEGRHSPSWLLQKACTPTTVQAGEAPDKPNPKWSPGGDFVTFSCSRTTGAISFQPNCEVTISSPGVCPEGTVISGVYNLHQALRQPQDIARKVTNVVLSS